jgi:polar amino acid transport system substrate-binding protein
MTNRRDQHHQPEGSVLSDSRRLRHALLAGTTAFVLIMTACGSDTKSANTASPAATQPAASTPAASAPAGGAVFDQALADALPTEIKDKGVLTLATDPTDPPLEFYNDKNELVGAEVDLANALGVVFGIKVELVPSKFDAIIPGVDAGRFDGSLSGFADRVERQKVVDFVDFFTSSRGYLIKTGTHPELAAATDLCGLSVAVAKGTTMADSITGLSDTCVADSKEPIDGQIYPDQSAGVLAVQSGRADLTILSDHAALAISQNSGGELDVVLRPKEGNDINGIVLRKGDLLGPVQKAIQQLMDNGTLLEIFTKWNLQELMLTTATVNAGVN